MIDLAALKAMADDGSPDHVRPITNRMLRQIVRELERGRAAVAMTQGQEQVDAMINSIRFERQPSLRVCDAVVIDAGDED